MPQRTVIRIEGDELLNNMLQASEDYRVARASWLNHLTFTLLAVAGTFVQLFFDVNPKNILQGLLFYAIIMCGLRFWDHNLLLSNYQKCYQEWLKRKSGWEEMKP